MPKETLIMIGNYLPITHWNKNVWHYLAENLEEAGWEVITTSSKENQILRLMDMVKTVWRESKNFHLAQIDVFSGRAFIFAEVCCAALRRSNKPIVLTLHGGGLPEFAMRYPRRMRHLLHAATEVVTPSHFLQKELHPFRPAIKVIPNPIDLSQSFMRQRDQAAPNLVWVRAFHKVYNPALAVEVINRLKTDFPQIHLTMIGPNKRDSSLVGVSALIDQYQLHQHVEVIPGISHDQIPTMLNEADIFVNTSNYDTSPRSLIEAMANGLCVVTTDVGGIPNIAEDHKDALLVPPNQPDQMAAAIREILEHDQLASHLSHNARKKAELYDWSAILPQWESLFSSLIKANHG